MDPPPYFHGGGGRPPYPPPRPSPRRELQLAGPRPSPLQVSKVSHKIKKPPLRPPLQQPQQLKHAVALPPPENLQPVIIYSVSPKIIHVEENNFMTTVQRLTGISPRPGTRDLSPAARLASIERASPKDRDRGVGVGVIGGDGDGLSDDDIMDFLERWDPGQMPGILSPAVLPPMPSGLFSPATGPSLLQDLSPFWHDSPSAALFSAPVIFSPSPSSVDLLNMLLEF